MNQVNRYPDNPKLANFLIYTAIIWSLFQLYSASPLILEITPWMNSDIVKRIHLIFAGFLAFLVYPLSKKSPQNYIPIINWVMAFLIVLIILYFLYQQIWNSEIFEMRLGTPNEWDLFFSILGIVLLLEASRRSLGLPLVIIAIIAILYAYFGWGVYEGKTVNKIVSHIWITTEGVFGIAIGVSASMVFLFVLFGSLLEQAGAGNYFIRIAFALMGHFRGGPAKAAVVSSAMTGMISGSSIANVVTTGTFTIPLMKKVGFSAEKAGAIEVASSTNGQLTPPIMGAAAFLMVEYVGISFMEVIKHAFLPAIISYIALIYIVHLEALKANMQGIPRLYKIDKNAKLIGVLSVIILLGFLVWVLPPLIRLVKELAGENTIEIIFIILSITYFILLYFASRVPDLPQDEIIELPKIAPTIQAGLHYLLPVVVLVWLLTVERLSPELSAFWASMFMIFIIITQKPLLDFFRNSSFVLERVKEGINDLKNGLINGAYNMIGIGIATAVAGIIVGVVTLTSISQIIIELVETISYGNIFLILLFTAIISLILGMGLPTTANYIVVSTLMAPVIVSLGAVNNIAIPLVAAHMFVFYFGILADDTPPVGLAAFAAAAISKGDPIKTGLQGFTYDIRTAILPFMFIFNTQLLMIDIDNVFEFIVVVISAVVAMLLFVAVTQGYWLVKSKWWESIVLLLCAFLLFRPDMIWDRVQPPFENRPAKEIFTIANEMKEGDKLQFVISGTTVDKIDRTYTFSIPLANGKTGKERISNMGIEIDNFFGPMEISSITPHTKQIEAIQQAGVQSGWRINYVQIRRDVLPKQLIFIPTILIIVLIGWIQLNRRKELNI